MATHRQTPDHPPVEHAVTQAALVEYLANQAVTELVIVSVAPGCYRLEAALSWRSGRSVLVATHGDARLFRSLDTIATLLRTIGTGVTLIRLELLH